VEPRSRSCPLRKRHRLRFTSFKLSMRVIARPSFCCSFYYAAGVVITLLLSILLAYFWIQRWNSWKDSGCLEHWARCHGLILISVLAAVGLRAMDEDRGFRRELAEI